MSEILNLFEAHGLSPKKKTAREWAGPCPACGGKDRCLVWPDDYNGRGGYRCRQCEVYGDSIQFLRDFGGLSYREACEKLGIQTAKARVSLPKLAKPAAEQPFESAPSLPPAELWQQRASAFLAWSHKHLLSNPEQLAWLAERGLPLEAVERFRLGFNPGDKGKNCLIRPRALWGLPLAEPKQGTDGEFERPKTTFWIPRGIVIPQLAASGQVLRLRIRRPDADRKAFREETKYYVIPGSSMDALILDPQSQAFVVVESELDALMLAYQAEGLAGAVSVMTANVRKIAANVHAALERALCVLVALDFDAAGSSGKARWAASFPRAKRWPAPVGKDPGEAFAQGSDMRAWILAGLPPVLQPGLLPPGMSSCRERRGQNVKGEKGVKKIGGSETPPPAPEIPEQLPEPELLPPLEEMQAASTPVAVLSTANAISSPESGPASTQTVQSAPAPKPQAAPGRPRPGFGSGLDWVPRPGSEASDEHIFAWELRKLSNDYGLGLRKLENSEFVLRGLDSSNDLALLELALEYLNQAAPFFRQHMAKIAHWEAR